MVKEFFPYGTRGDRGSSNKDIHWRSFPKWPPDMFAISASIVKKYDLYTMLACPDDGNLFCDDEVAELTSIALEYSGNLVDSLKLEKNVQQLWDKFVNITKKVDTLDCVDKSRLKELSKASFRLYIFSDEASRGIGFKWGLGEDEGLDPRTWVQAVYYQMYWGISTSETLRDQNAPDWNNFSEVLNPPDIAVEKCTTCILVPKGVACVQPKVKVPQVGCTLRSASHNLALLPPAHSVRVQWNSLAGIYRRRQSINILAIPFPFNVVGTAFKPIKHKSGQSNRYFKIEPNWLSSSENPTGKHFEELISHLASEAMEQVGKIDIVIFPEGAMNLSSYKHVYKKLKNSTDILIAGVIDEADNGKSTKAFVGNAACVSFIHESIGSELKEEIAFFKQNKHHRWKIDREQIKAYSIGDRLDPSFSWWENIALRERAVNFFTFNDDSCFATLVCEDLARIEPCQDVVRAIGPNLLFALLMDGPQIKGRWPERYAMGLSDDPGCSVLTLTSVGLLRRSNVVYSSNRQVIGLWRDPVAGTKELILPDDRKALLLTLNQADRRQRTLDGRLTPNDMKDVTWTLTGITPLGTPKTDREDAFG
jgi:hypothetical protein